MLPAYNPCVLRILVASPHPALRAGLKVLLAPRLAIVGEAATLAALFDEVRATRPAVIVFDLALEPDEAMAALWQLRAEWPALGVLALAESDADGRVLAALQAGARGCLPKTAEAAELSEAIENVALGRAVLPAAATTSLIDQLQEGAAVESLSPREAEVLRAVASGLTNKAIALKLGISEHTVKFHLGSAMSKLGAASRAEAVASAMRRGLISV